MPLANCKKCGQLFNKTTNPVCPKCIEEEEALLRKAQAYLRKNPNATIIQLISDLEDEDVFIEKEQLEKWAEEKRINIVFDGEPDNKPRCSLCGREVRPGTSICATCKFTKLPRKSGDSEPQELKPEEPEKKPRSGMHYKRWGD
jgi:uncharacterized protein